ARDNKSLGKFLLTGILPAPRGVPQIEVSFEIDVNGILKVSAQDKATGKEQSIRITNTGGLSSGEVERMREEAEQYAEEDRRRMELVELRNQADSILYTHETTLKDNAEFIRDDLKAQAESKRQELEAAFKDPSLTAEEVKTKLEEFKQVVLSVGTDLYNRASQGVSQEFESVEEDSEAEEEIVAEEPVLEEDEDEEEEFSFDFDDEDETVAADYEPVD
ncbi:MAG: Hsp70 family protein, partial [Kamptonema sp. SIO4C4]|nr:Hsp70 family protein [Kamptonema sp. SIO4C4]